MKHILRGIAVLLCVATVTVSTPRAEAASSATAAQLSYLQAKVIALQAELAALLGSGSSYRTADVTVITDTVTSNRESVLFNGMLSFTHDNEATVWFEYGPSPLLTYSTPSQDIRQSSGSKRFSAYGDAVTSGSLTYYRAVAQDGHGRLTYGLLRSFVAGNTVNDYDWSPSSHSSSHSSNSSSFDEPRVETGDEDDVFAYSAEISGTVDMRDGEDGTVFFAYGENQNEVEDVSDDHSYSNIDEDDEDLQVVSVESNFDDEDDFSRTIGGLNEDTDIYYRLCVSYSDEDDDSQIECGSVERFTTDND